MADAIKLLLEWHGLMTAAQFLPEIGLHSNRVLASLSCFHSSVRSLSLEVVVDIRLLLAERATPLSVTEAAQFLGCHPITLYRKLESGSFPGYRVGARWKINPCDVLLKLERGANQ